MAKSTIIFLTLLLGATALQNAQLSTLRVKVVQPPARVDLTHVPDEIRALAMNLFGPERSADVLRGAESQKIALGDRELTLFGAADDGGLVRFPTEFGNHFNDASDQDFDQGEVLVDIGGDLGSWAMANYMHQPQVKILKVEPQPEPYLFQRWNLLANRIPLMSEDQFSDPSASGVLIVHAGPTAAGRMAAVEDDAEASPIALALRAAQGDKDARRLEMPSRMAAVEDDAKARENNAIALALKATQSNKDASGLEMPHPRPGQTIRRGDMNVADFLKKHGVDNIAHFKVDCKDCEHEIKPQLTALQARRPHGARRRARDRALARELDAEVHTKGCANLGNGKWFADAHNDIVNLQQNGCEISFTVKTRSGQHKKRGVIRGAGVFVEPPFPEGKVLSNQTVMFENGAQWVRKW